MRYSKKDLPSVVTKLLTLLLATLGTASSLFSDRKFYFDADNVPLSNIAGIGTDGASGFVELITVIITQ